MRKVKLLIYIYNLSNLIQFSYNSVSEFSSGGSTTDIFSSNVTFGNDVVGSLRDLISMIVQA